MAACRKGRFLKFDGLVGREGGQSLFGFDKDPFQPHLDHLFQLQDDVPVAGGDVAPA